MWLVSSLQPGTLEDLPGGVLEVNMGVPLVVVCSKCDLITVRANVVSAASSGCALNALCDPRPHGALPHNIA